MVLRLVWVLYLAVVVPASPTSAGGSHVVSVPALGVQGEGLPGVVNYIVVQLDHVVTQDGPTVQFNEVNLGGGSLVGEEWKEGVRRAVQAVIHTVGESGRDWLITIKNHSRTSLTDGASASAAVAVAIMAAYRGDVIGRDIVLSGQITSDGRVDVVGGLPVKIEAAARRRVQLIQVGTLDEAYQAMTAR